MKKGNRQLARARRAVIASLTFASLAALVGACGMAGGTYHDRRWDEIDSLESRIEDERTQLAQPGVGCTDSCRSAGAICDAAERICEIAADLRDERANGRCARARDVCAAGRSSIADGCTCDAATASDGAEPTTTGDP